MISNLSTVIFKITFVNMSCDTREVLLNSRNRRLHKNDLKIVKMLFKIRLKEKVDIIRLEALLETESRKKETVSAVSRKMKMKMEKKYI